MLVKRNRRKVTKRSRSRKRLLRWLGFTAGGKLVVGKRGILGEKGKGGDRQQGQGRVKQNTEIKGKDFY